VRKSFVITGSSDSIDGIHTPSPVAAEASLGVETQFP
jgi:hypothetical protein